MNDTNGFQSNDVAAFPRENGKYVLLRRENQQWQRIPEHPDAYEESEMERVLSTFKDEGDTYVFDKQGNAQPK